ncbi:sn-1-specific diacylglycerol lipase ABHD11 isoform X2 [Carettochelys insculpta]|uniref:sn-1-specific diacylglycerol lipase ABHD11 isoform X2 n=1 Tax=Carettochelys insculpta TaxID=44489 RepID=UPI003EBF75FA
MLRCLPRAPHRPAGPRPPSRAAPASFTAAGRGSAAPLPLSYMVFDGSTPQSPLVFLHGLLGSKSNFRAIARALVQRTGRKVLTVDARNHGDSPHSPTMSYEAMSLDVQRLLRQLHLPKCVLIGHSMGGKTAMTLALQQPDLVERLVSVDISPTESVAVTNFQAYISAMRRVSIPNGIPRSTARRLAEDQLYPAVQASAVRRFLLTNLVEVEGRYMWRVNLEAISQHMADIMGFPVFHMPYPGPTLFLAGSDSSYVSSEDYPEIERLFPKAEIHYITGAGHWVHADKSQEFITAICNFLLVP